MIRRKKKGFTIVELVIVIAVIGILAAILIPTFVSLNDKANKAADDSLVHNLNTAMSIEEGEGKKNSTYNDAIEYLDNYGYRLANLATKAGHDLLWNSKTNRFLLNEDSAYAEDKANTGAKDVDYWTIKDSIPAGTKFSIYAGLGWNDANPVSLNGIGFDAGKHSISSISYGNTGDAKDVTIRTNSASTSLTVSDTTTGSIRHYGSAGALNIIQCYTESYHENGKVAFAEISKGRIVLEKGADVEEIHVNKKENEQAFDTVIIANNGGEEELPERITRDAVTVTEETLVVKVEANGASENVYVYASGTAGTTEKTNTQNTAVDSPLGQLVLDNGSNPGEKAQTYEQKEAAKEEAVENAKDDEKSETAIVATKGSNVIECSLSEFRDRVNGLNGFDPETFEGYVVTLVCNVDLKNEEWIPIGTVDHPFSGVFDGENHTVRNLKITEYTASKGVGLFGNLVGDESMPIVYTNISQIWNNDEFNQEFFAETNYSARVSNIKVSNFEINSTIDFNGPVVGYAKYAYVSDATVSNGTITATGKAGGVIGSTGRDMVAKNLVTTSDVTVTGAGHSIGGIIAGFNRDDEPQGSTRLHAAAAINCINNANIINNTNGIVGGIVGHLGDTRGLCGFVYNCTNNGNISLNNNGGNKLAGGILGDGKNAKVIANCTNNGDLNVVSTASGWYVAGISTNTAVGGTIFFNCTNNGDINAYATRLAGITALENTGSEINTNCENNGLLITTNPNGAVYQLTGGHYSKQTYTADSTPISNIDGVNGKIDDNFSIYEFNGYGEIDGELVINNTYVTISADSRICSTVSIQNSTTQTVILDIPGISCTISGDMSNLTLVMKGAGSQAIIANGAKIGKLQIEGTNSSATINGEVKNLILAGDANPSVEITTTGKCERVSFSGSGNFTLTNRGLISCTCGDQWGTWHVVTTQSACTITVNNYGTIESKTGEYGKCAYALLFYNGCDVTFNAYNGSHLTSEAKGLIMACWSSNSVTINYEEGAELIDGGSSRLYPTLAGNKVTVNLMD